MQLSLHEVRHFVKKKKKEKTSGKQDQNALFCNLKKKIRKTQHSISHSYQTSTWKKITNCNYIQKKEKECKQKKTKLHSSQRCFHELMSDSQLFHLKRAQFNQWIYVNVCQMRF